LSSPAEPAEPAERDEFYADGLVARIYAPGRPGRLPGLVEVHGGAWNGLSYRERFGLTRIGALGNSSGGHQVMLTALLPGEPGFTDVPADRAARLDFVVLCWPVIDPLARYAWGHDQRQPSYAGK
jgi:acetyl esterase/lipase